MNLSLKDMLAIGVPALLGLATIASYVDDIRTNSALNSAVAAATTEEEAVVDPTATTK